MITRLDLYGEDADAPVDAILFTDAGAAEDARRSLLSDDGLAGLDRIEVVSVPTDADGVADFYLRIASDR